MWSFFRKTLFDINWYKLRLSIAGTFQRFFSSSDSVWTAFINLISAKQTEFQRQRNQNNINSYPFPSQMCEVFKSKYLPERFYVYQFMWIVQSLGSTSQHNVFRDYEHFIKKICSIHIPFKNNHLKHGATLHFLLTIWSRPEEWNHNTKIQTNVFEGDNNNHLW